MPKGPKGEKRPADVVGAAVKVAKIATGEIEEEADSRQQRHQLASPEDCSIWHRMFPSISEHDLRRPLSYTSAADFHPWSVSAQTPRGVSDTGFRRPSSRMIRTSHSALFSHRTVPELRSALS